MCVARVFAALLGVLIPTASSSPTLRSKSTHNTNTQHQHTTTTVEQPLNGRLLRIWVDAAPCNATFTAAVRNSTLLAAIAGPAGNATAPMSVDGYAFAAAANLTQPCAVKSGAGAGAGGFPAAGARQRPLLRAAAAALAAVVLAAAWA